MNTATESLPQNSLDSVGLSDRTRTNFMQEVSEFAEKKRRCPILVKEHTYTLKMSRNLR